MSIHQRFEQIVQMFPERLALSMGSHDLSYDGLNKKADQIAHLLISKGVKPGDVVGVCLPRSFESIAAIIAVLKTGSAYLPLDPAYPADRLQFMQKHAQARLILTDDSLAAVFSSSNTNLLFLSQNSEVDGLPFPSVKTTESDLVYVIYTSGSTGQPKGVCLGHGALENLLVWQNKQSGKLSTARTLQYTPLSFDVHFQEIFSTLNFGGTLVLIDEETRIDAVRLLNLIDQKKVNRLFLPYVALNLLAETAVSQNLFPSSLQHVTTAGEQLKVTSAIRSFFRSINGSQLFNHYGPSETHVVTSLQLNGDVSAWPDLPSIGSPIDNCQVHILDAQLNPVAPGTEGEIYLGGVCLARGYMASEQMTQEKFLQTTFGRLYRTGDIGILTADGTINFLGRKDGQVKIRGHRIEKGEIEVALLAIKGVSQAAVAVKERGNEKFLVAYISGSVELSHVRESVKSVLPEYMQPATYLKLEEIPVTPSGKVDYKNLPELSRKRPELMNDFVPAVTKVEQKIAAIWSGLLELDDVGLRDSFFELGGNSLLASRAMAEMNKAFGTQHSVIEMFQAPTIIGLKSLFGEQVEKKSVTIKAKASESGDIAIIGMAGKFPGCSSIEELWDKILKSENLIKKFDTEELNPDVPATLRHDAHYVRAQGLYPEQELFDYRFFGMTPREAELMDPQQRKLLELSVEALENAGYIQDHIESSIGVFVGMGNSKYSRLVDLHPEKVQQSGDFNVMLGLEKDYIATRLAYKLDLRGPALSIHTGCSTSLVSIIEAVKSLRSSHCDMALAGGISISGMPGTGHLYQEGGILSQDGVCRPFDASATGTVFTEGAGLIVLKKLQDAERDGDTIHAVIKGIGINNDGADKMSFTAPSARGQEAAITMALADAGLTAEAVTYVEAHGTATPVGDPIEVQALKKAFAQQTTKHGFCHVGSLKSNLGHLTSAAGVAGLIKSVLVVREGIIPPTANLKTLNPELQLEASPFTINSQPITISSEQPRVAGVSSFGVGGTNAHVILEEYKPKKKEKKHSSSALLFKLSAKSEASLAMMEKLLLDQLEQLPVEQWASVAYTLEVGRKQYQHRKALVLANKSDLCKKKSEIITDNHLQGSPAKLAFLFSGQGSQYVGMGLGLYESSAVFREIFDDCLEKFEKLAGFDLRPVIAGLGEQDLNDTVYTQPALFILEYSLARTLMVMGIAPQLFVGHSIGEYAAATVAGIFTLEDGLKVIAKRAELLSRLPRGEMLSVASSENQVKERLSQFKLDLAAVNGTTSVVVAGEAGEMARFKANLDSDGIGHVSLKTSHAFHSRMMEGAVEEFKAFLDGIQLNEPSIPLFSTVSLNQDAKELQTSAYWAQHIVEPVRFAPAIEKLLASGKFLFIEIGPKTTLTSLTRKLIAGQKVNSDVHASLGQDQAIEHHSVVKLLGKLWLHGFALRSADLLFAHEERRRVPAPVYSFEKTRAWLDRPGVAKSHSQSMIQNTSYGKSPMNDQNKTLLADKLIAIFEASSGIDVSACGNEMSFLEMGMDSLFLTQISLQLKKELKAQVTFRQLLEEYSSINLLTDYLLDKVNLPKTEVAAPVVTQSASVMPQPTVTVSSVPRTEAAAGLEAIIQRQLDLMQEQIQLLKGQPATQITQPVQAPAPVVSSPAPKARGADIKTAKDSFGAAAKINVEKTLTLTPNQKDLVQDFFRQYTEKTAKSKAFTQKHRKTHADPRVVTGFKPENKEIVYPIVVNKSKGQDLWDLDGNHYIDMTCGFGSNFFGNGNERIKKYTLEQMESGIEIGPQHPLVGELSELICELTGNDRAAFCNTGSEAVLGAMRLARTVTGREKIIVFSGSYHGINDEVIIRAAREKSHPAAPGINNSAVSSMIVLDYGTEESLQKIREMASEVAAVLVEPVQSRRCNFHPKEFLQELRKITQESQTCLIFDEVITGFRIHPAGAQAYFNIKADLCTYGKIVGGGMPIGVISGKSEYMDALDGGFWQYGDDSTPTVGVTYFAGTFVRHPLALAAAKGALEIIRDGGEKQLNDLTLRATKFAEEINLFCRVANIPLEMHNFGSLMKPKWMKDVAGGELLFAILRYNGVHVYDGFPWFVNLAHTQKELDFVLEMIKKSLATLQMMGFLPESRLPGTSARVFDVTKAPVKGARLGKDETGNPAWFVEDPSNPGEYFILSDS